jgi:hypothetical protein
MCYRATLRAESACKVLLTFKSNAWGIVPFKAA